MRGKVQKLCWVGVVVSVLVFPMSRFFANQATKTLDREYDPVVVRGSLFSPDLTEAPISELVLYKYRADGAVWEQIPWQIDEIDTSGFFGVKDGLFDNDDQLVFMAKDAGDQAPETDWIDNPEARANSRFELEIKDPVDPSKKGWVYLYRSPTVSPDPGLPDYMQYTPPGQSTKFNDIIDGMTYRAGHKFDTGIVNHYSILPGVGGSGLDLVDQQKARIRASTFLGDLNLNEEGNLVPKSLNFVDGRVRIIREVVYDIEVSGTALIEDVGLITMFYPYNSAVGAKGIEVPSELPFGAQLRMFRTSVDFSPNATGMKLFNPFNPSGVTIDGSADAIADTLVENTLNWIVVTGDPGTIAFLIDVSDAGDSQRMYYDDSGTANDQEADGTDKTGDGSSIGDTGLIVRGDLSGQTLNLGATTVFLPPNQPAAEIGPQLTQDFGNPVLVTPMIQIFDVTAPAAVADLTVTSVGDDFVTLMWTAPTEDGGAGGAVSSYAMRRATTPVGSDVQAWWDAATDVTGLPTPSDPGTTETVTVSGLNTTQTHYFVLRSVDDFGNISGFSNPATALPVPVTLVSLITTVERNRVRLEWRTANETNNLGFEIERRRLPGAWETIGFVEGAGTTTAPRVYTYVDDGLQSGVYEYRILQLESDGGFEILDTIRVEIAIPTQFVLEQNFPNPFNPATTIRYQVGKESGGSNTQIAVFDLLGREVRRLVDAQQEPGYYEVVWDGRDDQGRIVPSGIYFVRLQSGSLSLVRRMVFSQ